MKTHSMKTRPTLRSISTAVATLIALAGLSSCGVRSVPVENRPPVLNKDLVQFDVTYGKFTPNFASVFLWPDLQEAEMAAMVAKVSGASNKADPFLLDSAVLTREIDQMTAQWSTLQCAANHGELQPGDDPDFMDYVSAWKEAKDVTDAKELALCQKNQSVRQADVTKRDANNIAASPFLQDITLSIDPDQSNIQNTKTLDATRTSIEILRDETGLVIHITLGGFLNSQNNPTTDLSDEQLADPAIVAKRLITDVSYNEEFRNLKFTVSDVDKAGQPTGNLYKFALERTIDHGPIARFTGEMNLVSPSGAILRYGMGRIDAFIPGR